MLNMDVYSLVDNDVAHILTKEMFVMLGMFVRRYVWQLCLAYLNWLARGFGFRRGCASGLAGLSCSVAAAAFQVIVVMDAFGTVSRDPFSFDVGAFYQGFQLRVLG